MKNNWRVFLFASLVFLSSCSIMYTISLLKRGSIDNECFVETINYENRAGLIIIQAVIKYKLYNFIFDTGAPCAISSELAQELGLEAKYEVTSVDSDGNKGKTGFVEIDELKIGRLSFLNIGAAIFNLKKIQEMECIKVDGIIGANLMRKAKWQINYQNQTLTFTDDLKKLDIPDNSLILDFNSSISGTPRVNINLLHKTTAKDIIFDTGFTGSIFLSTKIYEKLVSENKDMNIIKGYGATSKGAYGAKSGTSHFVKLNNLKIDQLNLTDIIVEFKGNEDGFIGNELFQNYKVALDWDNNKIYMTPVKQVELNKLMTFGFKPIMKDNKLLVGFVYENSPADSNFIKVNDQIISINEIDYSHLSITDYCDYLLNNVEWKNNKSIELKWKNTNGIVQSAKLNNLNLFNTE